MAADDGVHGWDAMTLRHAWTWWHGVIQGGGRSKKRRGRRAESIPVCTNSFIPPPPCAASDAAHSYCSLESAGAGPFLRCSPSAVLHRVPRPPCHGKLAVPFHHSPHLLRPSSVIHVRSNS
uniref:Uncharacterized protein n=1 Tax=Physcomitrium patens TaxID=3218 RepID=A0A2K1JY50_PHYPA|nr:hypothetical protein PHYPA_013572 [Physcomitrium patens]